MANAKCKCGQTSMNFPHLPPDQIDGKWQGSCCKKQKPAEVASQEEPKPKAKKKKKAQPEESSNEPKND